MNEQAWMKEIAGECEICKLNKAEYRCARCGVVYCSVKCFRVHNEKCVTSFAQDLLASHSSPKNREESRIQMQKILQNQTSTSQIPVGVEVEPWEAWWMKSIVVNAPHPNSPIPPKASPLLKYHLIDILYSYCYTMRLYNGDVSFDFEGASDVMISISSILESTIVIQSVKQAFSQCIERCKNASIYVEDQWLIEIVNDVEKCLQTQCHVYRALSESLHIITNDHANAQKKIGFFFAWSQILNNKLLSEIAEDVHDYYASMIALFIDERSKDND